MKINSKKFDFSKSELKEITNQVTKKIKPNISFQSKIEIEVNGKNYSGSYQNDNNSGTFTVSDEISTKTVTKVTETVLKKHTKAELQNLCIQNSIEFESDNNKATLIALLLPVLNGE